MSTCSRVRQLTETTALAPLSICSFVGSCSEATWKGYLKGHLGLEFGR